jgi:adenylate kinase
MNTVKNKKLIITLFGAPGSGKGTLSQYIVPHAPYIKHVSLGTVCRQYASQDTEIGKKIKFLIDNGNLVTLDIIENIISDIIKDFLKNDLYSVLLFDGYPRNYVQFESFFKLYNQYYASKFEYDIIFLQSEKDILIKRLINRYVCSEQNCEKIYSYEDFGKSDVCECCQAQLIKRIDDLPEIIDKRLCAYFSEEQKVLCYLKEVLHKDIFCLDANDSTQHLYNKIDSYLKKKICL